MMDVLEAIRSRKSIRGYKSTPVAKETEPLPVTMHKPGSSPLLLVRYWIISAGVTLICLPLE